MKNFTPANKLLIFLYVMAILLFCHHFIVRPMILDWGSSEEIRTKQFSGDRFTKGAHHTRGVLIDATPDDVWPWLVQMGQDRGGFYSYQWLENAFRAGMHNVYYIETEFQNPRKASDTIWLANKNHYNGQGYQILAEVKPDSSMVMVSGDDYIRIKAGENANGSWAFYIYPVNNKQTWLVARSSEGNIGVANKVLRYFFYEVPHFVMERKMLKTVKRLAEENRNERQIVTENN